MARTHKRAGFSHGWARQGVDIGCFIVVGIIETDAKSVSDTITGRWLNQDPPSAVLKKVIKQRQAVRRNEIRFIRCPGWDAEAGVILVHFASGRRECTFQAGSSRVK